MLPKTKEVKRYDLDGQDKGGNSFEILELNLDEAPDPSIFDIQFPAGKIVWDKRVNMNFRALENGQLVPLGAEDALSADVSALDVRYAVPAPERSATAGVKASVESAPETAIAAQSGQKGSGWVYVLALAILALSFLGCLALLITNKAKSPPLAGAEHHGGP